MRSGWAAVIKAILPGRFPRDVHLLSNRSAALGRAEAASPGPHPRGHLLTASWLGSGSACWARCTATAETLALEVGSQRCQTFRSGGVSRERYLRELNLRMDLAHALRAGSRVSVAKGARLPHGR